MKRLLHVIGERTVLLPFAVVALVSVVGCAGSPIGAVNKKAPSGTGFIMHEIPTGSGSKTKRTTIFVPFDYNPKRPMPAIVFLQGLGEGGNDGVKNTTVGLAPAIAKRASTFPFIAIFPQSSGGTWSSDDSQKWALTALDYAASKYNVDRGRVYLTGLSTGGYGTWAMGAKYPGRFAALVPMCAHNGSDYAKRLTHIPVWAFHNSGDPFVWASGTRSTVKKINDAGGNARITIYNALGHDCWGKAYSDSTLYDWMLAQRK